MDEDGNEQVGKKVVDVPSSLCKDGDDDEVLDDISSRFKSGSLEAFGSTEQSRKGLGRSKSSVRIRNGTRVRLFRR